MIAYLPQPRFATRSTWILLFAILASSGCSKPAERVVVYSAQDREFAEGIFADFTKESGLEILPKFDTEANKSVGLALELEQERERPRCDLHWNNEILGTIRLARKGLYRKSKLSDDRFPEWTHASGTWHAFATRARVLIVNTQRVAEADRPKSLFDLTKPELKGKVAMARPVHGTTATHAACLFELLGEAAAKEYYLKLKANDVQIVPGNKQVAVGVAEGRYACGWTDSDDAILELEAGKPVAIVFPDAAGNPDFPRLGTLYIPNTIAIIEGAPNPDGAEKLARHLLSVETEQRLAEGGGRQFPLGSGVTAKLPASLKSRKEVKAAEVNFERAADLWEGTIEWMRTEFLR